MTILLTIIHILVCFFLIIVVLLQSGKAADLAGAFGGMGSQTTFGPRGSATVLSKATTISAAIFMVTSLFLSVATTRSAAGTHSVLPTAKPVTTQSAPGTLTPPQPVIHVNPGNGTATPSKGIPLNAPQPAQQNKPAQPAPAPKK